MDITSSLCIFTPTRVTQVTRASASAPVGSVTFGTRQPARIPAQSHKDAYLNVFVWDSAEVDKVSRLL